MTDDHAAIRELITGYALALDAGDVDECVQLFTADAEIPGLRNLFRRTRGPSQDVLATRHTGCT